MSGFEFHLRCDACGLTSPLYPFRFDRVARPGHAVLPTADRAAAGFDVVRLAVADKLDAAALAALAAGLSSPDRTVCVPHLDAEAPRLEPRVACPRCGADTVRARFGAPPHAPATVASVDEVVEASRALAPGAVATWQLGARAALSAHRHGGEPDDPDDATTCAWRVTRPEGVSAAATDIAAVVAELARALERAGSTVEPPRVRKAFTDLVERRRAHRP